MKDKHIPANTAHNGFIEMLEHLKPDEDMFNEAKRYIGSDGNQGMSEFAKQKAHLEESYENTEQKIDELSVNWATAPEVIQKRLTKQIETLETQQREVETQIAEIEASASTLPKQLDRLETFLHNPAQVWEAGSMEEKRLMLEQVFGNQLIFSKEDGYRNVRLAPIYGLFGRFDGEMSGLVELREI